MPEPEQRSDEQLRQLAHDVRHCLHVIGLGTEMLKGARDDERRFAELCESIDRERQEARRLVDELVATVFADNNHPRE